MQEGGARNWSRVNSWRFSLGGTTGPDRGTNPSRVENGMGKGKKCRRKNQNSRRIWKRVGSLKAETYGGVKVMGEGTLGGETLRTGEMEGGVGTGKNPWIYKKMIGPRVGTDNKPLT